MNKNEFVSRLAAHGYTKVDAAQIVQDVVDTITECLMDGEEVNFHGFGTFAVKDTAARETTDFQTKERIVIPGHKVPKFTAGKYLRRVVKEGKPED